MRNLWIQTEAPFATWMADLSALRSRPGDLLEFVRTVLDAGAEQQVFVVLEAPLIGYLRERDGAELIQRLSRLHREHGIVDAFAFTGAAMAPGHPQSSTACATMAWHDASDRLVQGPCTDLGSLLETLEPEPGSIPRGFMKHYPPLRITGPRLEEYGKASSEPMRYPENRPVTVRFAIQSDIWFPWIFGSAHPECDHKRMFDNRELASRHTPRLNAFLRTVGATASALGGSWSVDLEETGENALLWLDEQGIHLDAEPPTELMPPEALDAEWF
jgi:hypothetical protein